MGEAPQPTPTPWTTLVATALPLLGGWATALSPCGQRQRWPPIAGISRRAYQVALSLKIDKVRADSGRGFRRKRACRRGAGWDRGRPRWSTSAGAWASSLRRGAHPAGSARPGNSPHVQPPFPLRPDVRPCKAWTRAGRHRTLTLESTSGTITAYKVALSVIIGLCMRR